MTQLTVQLSDEISQRLTEISERAGVRPEQLAQVGLEEWLARPREDFERIAQRIFAKNAELYRRLA